MLNTRENCSSFLGGYRCKKLTVKICIGEDCAFYKTADEAKTSKEKANKRLRSLPKIDQQYIADKYHNGKMIWNKGGTTNDC